MSDFSFATDLAAKHPEKLKELQALSSRKRHCKFNVYPVANNPFELAQTGTRPKHVAAAIRRTMARARSGFRRTEVIDIKNRSFSIIAGVENVDEQGRRDDRYQRRDDRRLRAPGSEWQADLHLQLARV